MKVRRHHEHHSTGAGKDAAKDTTKDAGRMSATIGQQGRRHSEMSSAFVATRRAACLVRRLVEVESAPFADVWNW